MKFNRMLAILGLSALMAAPAFAQSPQIPMGAGVNVDRPPVGSRTGGPARRRAVQPPAAQPSAAGADRPAMSQSCSQQASAKGLHGRARRAFRDKCRRNGGR